MSLKQVLIIQTDDLYFLHETLQVLSHNTSAFTEYELTFLVTQKNREALENNGLAFPPGTTTDVDKVLHKEFDLSFNLSLNEKAWEIHRDVRCARKSGPFYQGHELIVNGVWPAWFLTFKGNTPFVTFHMREIYRNILGVKRRNPEGEPTGLAKTLIIGMFSPDFFPPDQQEAFLSGLVRRFPGVQVLDESEVIIDQNHSDSLYIGPSSLKALLLCESGARGIYFGSRFQGLNLLPEKEGTMLITTGGKKMEAQSLLGVLEIILKEKEMNPADHLNIYRLSMENTFGAYLQCLSGGEVAYPFYQAHLVLWNYLLNLLDVNLDIVPLNVEQRSILELQTEIVTKLLRLHDYAMVALDGVYKEAKNPEADADKIQKSLTTLQEVDETMDKISATNPFIRPVLDFYKIRKGQTAGETLLEKSQNSLLTYSEEHQALKAYEELLLAIAARK